MADEAAGLPDFIELNKRGVDAARKIEKITSGHQLPTYDLRPKRKPARTRIPSSHRQFRHERP